MKLTNSESALHSVTGQDINNFVKSNTKQYTQKHFPMIIKISNNISLGRHYILDESKDQSEHAVNYLAGK